MMGVALPSAVGPWLILATDHMSIDGVLKGSTGLTLWHFVLLAARISPETTGATTIPRKIHPKDNHKDLHSRNHTYNFN